MKFEISFHQIPKDRYGSVSRLICVFCTFLACQDKFIHEVAGRSCFQPCLSVILSLPMMRWTSPYRDPWPRLPPMRWNLTVQGPQAPTPVQPRPPTDMFTLFHYESYCWQVGGLHPTGMFSCWTFLFSFRLFASFYYPIQMFSFVHKKAFQ